MIPRQGCIRIPEHSPGGAAVTATIAVAVLLVVLWRGPAEGRSDLADVPLEIAVILPPEERGGANQLGHAIGSLASLAPVSIQHEDALLLRRAFTPGKLNTADYEALLQRLRTAFDNTQSPRMADLPLREQALFAMLIDENPQAALARAKENWALEKGWEDATLLIDAARAAARPEADQAVLDWRQRLQKGEL